MNLDQLKTFLVAAEALNFTKAAEILHLTQPAVSQQIKELEHFFQTPLFERRGRQVQLSAGGEKLRPYARRVLSQIDEAKTVLGELSGRTAGRLSIGSGNTVGIYLLPGLLGRFQRDYPEVLISLKVGQSNEILDMLTHGELDLALLEESPAEAPRALNRLPFLSDELVLIAPPLDHPASAHFPAGAIAARELVKFPLLMRHPSSRTRQLIQSRLADAGVELEQLRPCFELGNTEAIKRGVMAGLGLGWVSTYAIEQELEAGMVRVVPVRDVSVRRQLWLVAQQNRFLPERVARFQAFLLAEGERLQDKPSSA